MKVILTNNRAGARGKTLGPVCSNVATRQLERCRIQLKNGSIVETANYTHELFENNTNNFVGLVFTKYATPVFKPEKAPEQGPVKAEVFAEILSRPTKKHLSHNVEYELSDYKLKMAKAGSREYIRGFYIYLKDAADHPDHRVEIYHDIKSLKIVVNYNWEFAETYKSGAVKIVNDVELKYSGPTEQHTWTEFTREYRETRFSLVVMQLILTINEALQEQGVNIGTTYLNGINANVEV